MLHMDEKPETVHLYVVREADIKPPLFPIVLSVLALFALVICCVFTPYEQPVTRAVIRVPAVLLPPRTFTTKVAVIPTGIRTYAATTAHGVLTITNGSIIGQSIPAGFALQGVVTDNPVYVPPGTASGYGWAQVSAHALMAGKDGNLPALAINSVIGSSVFVRNLTSFSGGRDSYAVTYVTSQDRSAALAKARNSLLRMSVGLHYPCQENISGNTRLHVVWVCQFVTYHIPSFMSVSSVRIIGKNLLLAVTFTPRQVRVGMK